MTGKLSGNEEKVNGWIAVWPLDVFGCLVSSAVL